MGSISREKIATLLDGLADYVDGIESQRHAERTAAIDVRLDKVAESYELATGSSISPALREKLSNLDTETLDDLLKIAKNKDESPDALGGPAYLDGDPPIKTAQQAANDAEDKFLSWLTSE